MKLRLIDNWKRAYKFGSVQIAAMFAFLFAIGPTLIQTWAALPQDLKDALPEGTSQWVSVLAFVLIVMGRVVKIEKPEDDKGDAS